MPLLVGVKFEQDPRVYHFGCADLSLRCGDRVIAQSWRDLEVGVVVEPPREVAAEDLVRAPQDVVRVATPEDIQRWQANRRREESALQLALQQIERHRLEMKVVGVHYAFDGSKVTLYFTADGRVDFRQLVKDLASGLRCRVHLLQIGARDAARAYGGLGVCGREFCCAAWLRGFDAISMRMAKDQSLFLNPSKFSGSCGKLMCCLRYEHDLYVDAKGTLPSLGSIWNTSSGPGKVVEVSVIRKEIVVEVPDVGHVVVGMLPVEKGCEGCRGCYPSDASAES